MTCVNCQSYFPVANPRRQEHYACIRHLHRVAVGAFLALIFCGMDRVTAEDSAERVEGWKNRVDLVYRNRGVRHSTLDREYEEHFRLMPETDDLIEAGRSDPAIADLVLKAIVEAVAEPDRYKRNAGSYLFPFVFCELSGLNARRLLYATRTDEMFLQELIVALYSDHPVDLTRILDSRGTGTPPPPSSTPTPAEQ